MSAADASNPLVAERPRTLVGRIPNLGDREYVYRCDDALEIDQVDGYEVETKRVFFSDVELITWHQRYSAGGLWIGGLSLLGGLLLWLLMASSGEAAMFWVGFWVFFFPNLPVMAWFLWPYWYVTVFGRRGSARMRWHFRRATSRQVFEELTRDLRAYQQAHADAAPVEETVPMGFAPPPNDATSPPVGTVIEQERAADR